MDDYKPWGMVTNTFLMLMHLSQLAGFVVPGAGLVLPIVMWATNKDQSPEVDRHGKNILNWMISLTIYSIVSCILIIIFVGFLALLALMILDLIFVILAAVKANEGELWPYPLSIKFFKVE
ncbi:DUF4870 domain-containing protein [Halioxenophilus sp. WMMB6]|uniref:DUF4870 domain-containing protein n=1 Tax=Halioxenophilus sp. WMMB6 TaxID=3073815 RepID=UPI00295EABD0|nr:DUF4870 domain-containing protein [Halioxenophilus sp. WMMB6]